MKRFPLASVILFGVLGAALFGGLVHLFHLRFGSGDIYPAYSSLRADPKGTRVLFESLELFPEITVIRHFRPPHRLESDAGTTLLLAGVNQRLTDSMVKEIERMLQAGARVVVSYYPFKEGERADLERLVARPLMEGAAPEEPADEEVSGTGHYASNFGRAFGFELFFKEGPQERAGLPLHGLHAEGGEGLPARLPEFWFSRLTLEPDEAWKVVARLRDEPVIIQRRVERGTLVVMTDSYWMSNEAMSLTRRTEFVAWLLGSPRTVIFEETHLGITEPKRLSHLMRNMNLEMPVGIALLLALLFIWKNGVGFPPREPSLEASGSGEVQGHDSQKGLLNLLRANIAAQRLLSLCWDEWLKGLKPAERKRLGKRIEAGEKVVKESLARPSNERNLLSDYQKVATIINERKEACKPRIQISKD